MQLEVFEALTSINVSPADARSVAASIDVAIRRAVIDTHAAAVSELVTRADLKEAVTGLKESITGLATKESITGLATREELRANAAELRTEIQAATVTQIKWMIGSQTALAALILAGIKLLH